MLLQQVLVVCWSFPARKAEGNTSQASVAQPQPSTHNQSLPHQHLNLNSRAEVWVNSPFHSLHCLGSRAVASRPRQHFKWLHQNSAKLFRDSANSEHVDGYGICTLHQTHTEGSPHPRKQDRKHFKKTGIKKKGRHQTRPLAPSFSLLARSPAPARMGAQENPSRVEPGGEWDKILRELEAFAKSSRK